MIRIYAFEPETGAALSTARKPYKWYGADGAEVISRFMTKNLWQGQALPELEKGAA